MPMIHAHVDAQRDDLSAFLARTSTDVDILDFVVGVDECGAPVLADFAPNVNELPW